MEFSIKTSKGVLTFTYAFWCCKAVWACLDGWSNATSFAVCTSVRYYNRGMHIQMFSPRIRDTLQRCMCDSQLRYFFGSNLHFTVYYFAVLWYKLNIIHYIHTWQNLTLNNRITAEPVCEMSQNKKQLFYFLRPNIALGGGGDSCVYFLVRNMIVANAGWLELEG